MDHIFIRSSIDGCLGCFHALAIVNSAAMNTVVHAYFSVMISSGYMPSSETAGSYSIPYYSPQWLYLFTFPPTGQEGSLFSTPSPAFIVCRFFDDGHSDQCEVIPHCSFDLHFLNNQRC